MIIRTMSSTNWLQDLINHVLELQHKLEDSKKEIGKNQQVQQQYEEALAKVKDARESINRLAAVFNKEYA